jgi:hypothetical protein
MHVRQATIFAGQTENLPVSDRHLFRGLQQVSSKKVLGVIIDEQLKWKEHNDAQCKKISQSIALLKRAKQFVSQDTLLNMFNALVLPHFTYCSNVWNDGSCAHIEKLHKLHKQAT